VTRYGYFLSAEEHAGFDALWISDHFHPWLDGQNGNVWLVIGAVSRVTDFYSTDVLPRLRAA